MELNIRMSIVELYSGSQLWQRAIQSWNVSSYVSRNMNGCETTFYAYAPAAKYSRRNLLFQGLPYPSWIISIFQTLLIAKDSLPVESLTCINVLLFWSSLAMFSLRKDDIHNQCMEMMPHHCAIVLLNSTILFCVIKRHSGNGAW